MAGAAVCLPLHLAHHQLALGFSLCGTGRGNSCQGELGALLYQTGNHLIGQPQ